MIIMQVVGKEVEKFCKALRNINVEFKEFKFTYEERLGMQLTFKVGVSYERLQCIFTTINKVKSILCIDYSTMIVKSIENNVVITFNFKERNERKVKYGNK